MNLVPVTFAPRSKSKIPKLSPISQCGFGAKENAGILPQVLISTLSSSFFPTGTSALGTFGIFITISANAVSISLTSTSSFAISSPTLLISTIKSSAFSLFFFITLICCDTVLRLLFNASTSANTARRFFSNSKNSFKSRLVPLLINACCTSSVLSLTNFISSILIPPLILLIFPSILINQL